MYLCGQDMDQYSGYRLLCTVVVKEAWLLFPCAAATQNKVNRTQAAVLCPIFFTMTYIVHVDLNVL